MPHYRADRPNLPWQGDAADGRGGRKKKSFATRKAAIAWEDEMRTAFRNGRATVKRLPTLGDAVDEWLALAESGAVVKSRGERYKLGSIEKYRAEFDREARPSLGRKRLNDVTLPLLARHVEYLRGRGLSSSTVANAFDAVRATCARAYRLGLIPTNPCLGLNLSKAAQTKRDRVCDERDSCAHRRASDREAAGEVRGALLRSPARWRDTCS